MSHQCSGCGETFERLSRKRLHDCPAGAEYGGDDPTERFPNTDLSVEEMTELAVERALICSGCGTETDEVDEFEDSTTERGVSFSVSFTCDKCGIRNTNSATLE